MIDFSADNNFSWSAKKQQIKYIKELMDSPRGKISILHELGHAIAGHNSYNYDIELLSMEVSAWQIAKELSENYDVIISTDYIENCLDSYRDWMHLRSTCVRCSAVSIQNTRSSYKCLNCEQEWLVSDSRLCRPYRRAVTNKTTLAI